MKKKGIEVAGFNAEAQNLWGFIWKVVRGGEINCH